MNPERMTKQPEEPRLGERQRTLFCGMIYLATLSTEW